MSICTTYRVHNAVKVIKIGVLVDRDVLLELRNQIEDRLVCGDEEVFFLICPIEQYVLSGILPGDMTMHMLRVSSSSASSLSSAAILPLSLRIPILNISCKSIPKHIAIFSHLPLWRHALVSLMGETVLSCQCKVQYVGHLLVFHFL